MQPRVASNSKSSYLHPQILGLQASATTPNFTGEKEAVFLSYEALHLTPLWLHIGQRQKITSYLSGWLDCCYLCSYLVFSTLSICIMTFQCIFLKDSKFWMFFIKTLLCIKNKLTRNKTMETKLWIVVYDFRLITMKLFNNWLNTCPFCY